jgi:hypothetical protein
MRSFACVAVTLLSPLSGCADRAPAPDGVQQQPPAMLQEGIELSETHELLDHGYTAASFDFNNLRDLWVRVKVRTMPDPATLRVAFTNPMGTVLYETTMIFSPDPAMVEMMMPGVDHAISVHPASPVPGGYYLDLPIPVAGGTLARFPMIGHGTWMVEAQIQGTSSSLNQMFQIP